METVSSNGDVNILLITAICVGIIITFFITVSIFTRGRKIDEEELDSHYDEDDDGLSDKIETSKRRRIKNTNKSSGVPRLTEGKTKTNIKSVSKRKSTVKPKPVRKSTKLIEGKTKTNTKAASKTKKPKVVKRPQKDVIKSTDSRVKEKVAVVNAPIDIIEELSGETNSINVDSSESLNKSNKVEKKESNDIISETKPVETKPVVVNDKQKTVKIEKIGNIQVNERFNLNGDERKMIESVMNSRNRGHIFQLFEGRKIMDLGIDSMNQLEHIEGQINRFPDNNGKYVVYLIWESNIKHIIRLSQKLRYGPNIRY